MSDVTQTPETGPGMALIYEPKPGERISPFSMPIPEDDTLEGWLASLDYQLKCTEAWRDGCAIADTTCSGQVYIATPGVVPKGEATTISDAKVVCADTVCIQDDTPFPSGLWDSLPETRRKATRRKRLVVIAPEAGNLALTEEKGI